MALFSCLSRQGGFLPRPDSRQQAVKRLGKVHLKVQRQRRDFAVKTARCVVKSNDFVVLEHLQIRNMVKNRHLAKSIGDIEIKFICDPRPRQNLNTLRLIA